MVSNSERSGMARVLLVPRTAVHDPSQPWIGSSVHDVQNRGVLSQKQLPQGQPITGDRAIDEGDLWSIMDVLTKLRGLTCDSDVRVGRGSDVQNSESA
jgi:hypothetical protein